MPLVFAVSALVLSRISISDTSATRTSQNLALDIRDGLTYILKHRVILVLLAMALLMNLGGAPLGIILPVFSEWLGSSAHAYGYMMAALSAGMVLGFWQAGAASARGSVAIVLSASVGTLFVVLASVLWLPPTIGLIVAFAILVLAGFLMGTANVRIATIMQLATDADYLGRVGSVGRMISLVASPLSLAAFGPLVDGKGPGFALLVSGLVILLAGLPFVGSSVWQYRSSTEASPEGR